MSIKTDNSQTLVNALAEIERLRGRCAELEEFGAELVRAFDQTLTDTVDYEDYETLRRVVDPFVDVAVSPESGAWLLRKQAEAVDQILEAAGDCMTLNGDDAYSDDFIRRYCRHLRNQADELENNNAQEH